MERERNWFFIRFLFREREKKKDWSMRRPSQAVASDVVLSVTKIAVLRMALVFLLISHPISPVLGGIQSSSTRSASAKSRGHLLPNSSVIYLEYIFFCCCCLVVVVPKDKVIPPALFCSRRKQTEALEFFFPPLLLLRIGMVRHE